MLKAQSEKSLHDPEPDYPVALTPSSLAPLPPIPPWLNCRTHFCSHTSTATKVPESSLEAQLLAQVENVLNTWLGGLQGVVLVLSFTA